MVSSGAFTQALSLIDDRLQHAPADTESRAVRAELLLFAGQYGQAFSAAQQALSQDPSCVLAQLVHAACQLRNGDAQGAVERLEGLDSKLSGPRADLPLIERSTVLCWLSLALHAAGDLPAAARAATRSMHSPGPQSLPAHLLRMKMVTLQQMELAASRRKQRPGLELDPLKRINDIWSYRELLARIEPLLESPEQAWSGVQGDLQQAMDTALIELGDNLSPCPSRQSTEGLPEAFRPPPSPRAESRQIQHLLRTRPIAEVLSLFRDLQSTHPDAVTPFTYMGEVLLWFGRTAEARVELRSAVDRDITTQWAWIGLGACELLEDRPQRAIEIFQEGIEMCRFEGPTMFAYRAEAWLEVGDLDRARQDIDQALFAKPQRLGAWLTRARIDRTRGEPDLAEALLTSLAEHCPHLFEAMNPHGRGLEGALSWATRAMRGNRSGSLPFFFPGDDPSFLRWQRKCYQPLLEQMEALSRPEKFRWMEPRPAHCLEGDCGPRCIRRERLQAWIGPAVGIDRWIRRSTATEELKDQAHAHLRHLQAQRRRVCPDLEALGQQAEALLQAISQQTSVRDELDGLCQLLSNQLSKR
jgi:tetratricopeptide (TPR) repeat protein